VRVAKWALLTIGVILGILILALVIGFLYGIMQLSVTGIRMLIRRISRRKEVTSCTK
jgi:hypothetical protein